MSADTPDERSEEGVVQPRLVRFGDLPLEGQARITEALAAGQVEVHCPWWPEGHWEWKDPKTTTGHPAELWEDAFYRISKANSQVRAIQMNDEGENAGLESSDLFAWSPAIERTRADQILEAFERFHRKNPGVWNLFERFTLQAIAAGRERYSSDAICHRIRWHTDIETNGESVKINDHYTAYYARLFHVAHPQHDGFFRNRRRISEKHNASSEDHQVFIDKQAGEEKAILSRLRNILNANDQ